MAFAVGEVPVGDVTLKVAVAHGMANVRQIMDEVREAQVGRYKSHPTTSLK